MVAFYQPLHEVRRTRDSLHDLRQRGSVDNYAKAFTLLVVKVPQMTLDEQLYSFIKGLKPQVQVSVALQSPSTLEEAKLWPPAPTGSSTSADTTEGPADSAPTLVPPPWN
jgi:Ty3 transposon capsid-like protein